MVHNPNHTVKPTSPKMFLLAVAAAGLLLVGCAGLSQLPANDSAYFRQKAEAALGSTNCIKELFLLSQNNKRIAVITLLTSRENAEERCLNAMRAMAHDPMVPSVDVVNVKAECRNGTRDIKKDFGGPVPITNKRGVTTLTDISVPVTIWTEEVFKTVYSCTINREALINGETPTVVIQNGVFVSGPNKGKVVDF
jgi:hypothetical protein